MKIKRILLGVSIFAISTASYSAGWLADEVKEVAVMYGSGCVTLNNGEVIKLDIETSAGKAELSIALAAKAAGKQLAVYQTDNTPVAGCNTGATVKPHVMLRITD